VVELPTPHLDVLIALFNNPQLPEPDRLRKKEVMARYDQWKTNLESAKTVEELVNALNDYKDFIDLDFTADGHGSDNPPSWLSRQKGQTKHSASIMEEFIPWLVAGAPEKLPEGFSIGPARCVLSLERKTIDDLEYVNLNQKDIDFAMYKTISNRGREYNIAIFGLEMKDHVDKTMINGTIREATELKSTFSSAFYGLLVGWRDLAPVGYQPLSSLDCFMLTRKAKRMGAPRDNPKKVRNHWEKYPYQADVFIHLFHHIRDFLKDPSSVISEVDDFIERISGVEIISSSEQKPSHDTLDSIGWIHPPDDSSG